MATYQIKKFIYTDRKSKFKFAVYAREEKTADEIISIVNDTNILFFKKPLFKIKFGIPYSVSKPPYEIEMEQLEIVEKEREKRYNYVKKNGGLP